MRYLPLSDNDRHKMMSDIGISEMEELFNQIPDDVRIKRNERIDIDDGICEWEVEEKLTEFANQNLNAKDNPFFIGAGLYYHHVPAIVDHIIQRSEFLTAYTPYQPEIAQGTLQMLFEFQTQITRLSQMDVANASMYDGSSATIEAVLMALRITKRNKVIISSSLHPSYQSVINTYSNYLDFEVIIHEENLFDEDKSNSNLEEKLNNEIACIVMQNPDIFGNIRDLSNIFTKASEHNILNIAVVNEIISLGLLKPPGAMGADVFVGEGQSIGNSMNLGGPILGLFATKQKYIRQIPGRIAGKTHDTNGKHGYLLTLNAREQHIRRQRATSNICTNSGLCALAFSIHMTLLGSQGLKKLAILNHKKAKILAQKLSEIANIELINKSYFNEFTIKLPIKAEILVDELAKRNILAGVAFSKLALKDIDYGKDSDNYLILATTELCKEEDMDKLVNEIKNQLK